MRRSSRNGGMCGFALSSLRSDWVELEPTVVPEQEVVVL